MKYKFKAQSEGKFKQTWTKKYMCCNVFKAEMLILFQSLNFIIVIDISHFTWRNQNYLSYDFVLCSSGWFSFITPWRSKRKYRNSLECNAKVFESKKNLQAEPVEDTAFVKLQSGMVIHFRKILDSPSTNILGFFGQFRWKRSFVPLPSRYLSRNLLKD